MRILLILAVLLLTGCGGGPAVAPFAPPPADPPAAAPPADEPLTARELLDATGAGTPELGIGTIRWSSYFDYYITLGSLRIAALRSSDGRIVAARVISRFGVGNDTFTGLPLGTYTPLIYELDKLDEDAAPRLIHQGVPVTLTAAEYQVTYGDLDGWIGQSLPVEVRIYGIFKGLPGKEFCLAWRYSDEAPHHLRVLPIPGYFFLGRGTEDGRLADFQNDGSTDEVLLGVDTGRAVIFGIYIFDVASPETDPLRKDFDIRQLTGYDVLAESDPVVRDDEGLRAVLDVDLSKPAVRRDL